MAHDAIVMPTRPLYDTLMARRWRYIGYIIQTHDDKAVQLAIKCNGTLVDWPEEG